MNLLYKDSFPWRIFMESNGPLVIPTYPGLSRVAMRMWCVPLYRGMEGLWGVGLLFLCLELGMGCGLHIRQLFQDLGSSRVQEERVDVVSWQWQGSLCFFCIIVGREILMGWMLSQGVLLGAGWFMDFQQGRYGFGVDSVGNLQLHSFNGGRG